MAQLGLEQGKKKISRLDAWITMRDKLRAMQFCGLAAYTRSAIDSVGRRLRHRVSQNH
ncbi:hypothetical protein MPLA_1670003 [Mesorhizobium sp. ORS 3359]|nr:hypothetical protein MPLA_1670003 [Mesorhizobium sp. ORS 3359]